MTVAMQKICTTQHNVTLRKTPMLFEVNFELNQAEVKKKANIFSINPFSLYIHIFLKKEVLSCIQCVITSGICMLVVYKNVWILTQIAIVSY